MVTPNDRVTPELNYASPDDPLCPDSRHLSQTNTADRFIFSEATLELLKISIFILWRSYPL
jgi:hypothetical protein